MPWMAKFLAAMYSQPSVLWIQQESGFWECYVVFDGYFQGTTSASERDVVRSWLGRLRKVARTCLHGLEGPLETKLSVASNCDGLPGPDSLLFGACPPLTRGVIARHPSALLWSNKGSSRSVHGRRLKRLPMFVLFLIEPSAPPVCSQLASLKRDRSRPHKRLTPPSRPQRNPDLFLTPWRPTSPTPKLKPLALPQKILPPRSRKSPAQRPLL